LKGTLEVAVGKVRIPLDLDEDLKQDFIDRGKGKDKYTSTKSDALCDLFR
jgi:hypothetical protein